MNNARKKEFIFFMHYHDGVSWTKSKVQKKNENENENENFFTCSGGFAIRLHLIFGFAIQNFLAFLDEPSVTLRDAERQMLIFNAAGFQIRPSREFWLIDKKKIIR